jgi:hypothetical protein
MNLNVVQLSVENNFNPIEYLKGKALEIVSINTQEELLQSLAVQNEELNEYAHVVSHDLKRHFVTLIR